MPNSAFSVTKPENSLGFLLWQTTITWQRLVKQTLAPYDVSHAQFVILAVSLWFMETQQRPTQMTIVRLSKLDKMTVSKALKKLVAQGLVKRVEHLDDTRAKSVGLTTKGKKLTTKLVALVEKVDTQFFAPLAKNKQHTLLASLAELAR